MLEFGFVEYEGPAFDQIELIPARQLLGQEKATSALSFFYGNQDVFEEAVEDKDLEVIADYLTENKELMATISLLFDDNNKLLFFAFNYIGGQNIDNIHQLYATLSKNAFLSLDEDKDWGASLMEAEDAGDESVHSNTYNSPRKRDKFEADFAEMECLLAAEDGFDSYDESTQRYYLSQWYGDAELKSKSLAGLVSGELYAHLRDAEP